MSMLQPRIYIACLEAYSMMDRIYGVWIDATQQIPLMKRVIEAMLLHGPVPYSKSWVIHCAEDFGRHIVRKNDSLEKISEMAHFIVKNGEVGLNFLDSCEGNLEMAKEFMKIHLAGN